MASITPKRVSDADGSSAGEAARTIAAQVIAAVLLAGVAYLMPGLVVPLLIALVLAICVAPTAGRMEGAGMPRMLVSLLVTLGFGTVLVLIAGLLVYQANAIVGEMDGHLDRLGGVLGGLAERSGFDGAVRAMAPPGPDRDGASDGHAAPSGVGSAAYWSELLGDGLGTLIRWLAAGIGGLIGVGAGAIVGLIALFFMLQLREIWIDRLLVVAERLGLCPNREGLSEVQGQVVTYVGFLGMIASSYVVLISLMLWALGVPRPLLWGLLTGMMEFVPIFGPLLSGSLATLATLASGAIWKGGVVALAFLTLHTVEGYVLWPIVLGKAIRFDQVTILLGILFFGGLLGPLGTVLGLPLMILLRGLIAAAPRTPALDALVEVEGCDPSPG